MTEHDRELNQTNPARRLGAAGLAMVMAEWHVWASEPDRSAYTRGLASTAHAEWRLAHTCYDGYMIGLEEGRRATRLAQVALLELYRKCQAASAMSGLASSEVLNAIAELRHTPDTENDDGE